MKKISSIFICLTLLLTTVPLILADSDANNIDITWMKTYGRFFNEELGVSVQQTSDGGFIAVGSISKSLFDVRGNKDVWLIKFDETGSILWNKTFVEKGMMRVLMFNKQMMAAILSSVKRNRSVMIKVIYGLLKPMKMEKKSGIKQLVKVVLIPEKK